MKRIVTVIAGLGLVGLLHAATPAPEGASVYFISPQNGETVSSPVVIKFGLKGMGVAPAGVEKANTGHHHLLVDTDQVPASGEAIPADDQHRHFGGGQTETTLELTPGMARECFMHSSGERLRSTILPVSYDPTNGTISRGDVWRAKQ